MNLKKWIEENLFTTNKYLNSKRTSKKWFIDNNFLFVYNEIFNQTKFLDVLDKKIKIIERLYYLYNDINDVIYCSKKGCMNPVNFSSFKRGYLEYCSLKCSTNSIKTREKTKQTCLRKYGTENVYQSEYIKNKIKKNNLKKYGIEYTQQLESTKEKYRKTCIDNYGVDNASKSKKILNKIKEKCLKNHGVECYWQVDQVKENINKIFLKKYGIKNPSQMRYKDKNIINILDNKETITNLYKQYKSIYELSINLNISCTTVSRCLHKHGIKINNYYCSKYEKEIVEFINIENIETNNKYVIRPYELDIYLPEYKLAIEFDGLYWHSKHNKNYHLNKTEMCREKGIQLFHIFENEWFDSARKDIWKSIINGKLGRNNKIYARKTEVREIIDNKLVKEFLNNNHLQGFVGSSVKIGLFYKDELISVMTFGKTRFSKKYRYEMIRFCTKKFLIVVGGASKLYSYFIRNYNPESVISYADRRYSNGNLYKKLGFEFSHNSSPNYWYFKNSSFNLYSRIKFQKSKLYNLLENFDNKKSEIENMKNNGYLRIFDCGNIIYKYIEK